MTIATSTPSHSRLAPPVANAIKGTGTFAFAVRFADGSSRILKASRLQINFLPEALAQMSTLVDVPQCLFNLSFDLEFLQDDGALEVYFGNTLLGDFTSADNGMAMLNVIDPFALFGTNLPVKGLLDFRLSGGAGVTMQIDNVMMPGLFDGWRPSANGGAIAVVPTQPDIIPLPAGGVLLLSTLSMARIGAGVRRRAGK